MEINVVTRSGRQFALVNLPKGATLDDLKEAVFKQKKVSVDRQYFTHPPATPNGRGEAVKEGPLNIQGKATLTFKDLGPQIGWRTVFILEYLGPLLAFPIIYALRPLIWGVDNSKTPLSQTQWIAFGLFVLHFLKREFETIFIHKFSKGTMPFFNLFKNSGYYWAYAFMNAYFCLHPLYTSPSETQVLIGSAIFIVGLIGTFICHIILSNLRPAGTTQRGIPRGFLFEFVSCPNYTCEILEWIGFTIAFQTVAALLFTITGAGQMWIWAVGKHKRYIKEFDGKEGREKYPRRKILIPFVL